MQSEKTRLLPTFALVLFAFGIFAQPTFTVSSGEDSQGQTVCIDITVADFTQIQTLQFSVNWDQSIATFDRVENFAVTTLTTANFNLTQTAAGKIGVSWEDFSFEGTTLNDGQVFFSICLQLTGNPGLTSAVRITDDPVTIDVTDANSMGTPIGQNLIDGSISIAENAGDDDLILYYDDVLLSDGASFCIPIRARNFKNITALQFSINFNNNRFRFDQISNLENWNGSGFASPSTFNANSKGEIGYAYIDFSFEAMGNNLEDGGVLFEICLTHMLDEDCVNDALILSNTPTDILGTHWPNDEEINVVFEPGRIKAGTPLSINNAEIVNVSCSNPNSGIIDLEVIGGELGQLYNWSNGASSSRIENLSTGNYIVTVSDQCLGVDSVVANYSILLEGTVPVANAGGDATLTCQNTSFSLQGSGSGANNLGYMWRGIAGESIVSGANTPDPVVDMEGIYELEVTNLDNGCTAVDSVEIFSTIDIPNADAGNDQILECNDINVTLNGSNSSSGSDFSYFWNTTDGNILSDPNQISITADKSGTYSLMVVNTISGCESFDEVMVLGDNTVPQVGITGSELLTCSTTELMLNANNGGNTPNQIYSWSTTDGNILTGTNSVDAVIDEPGTYTVTVTNSISNCSEEASVTIAADQNMPTADAGNDQMLQCNTAAIALDGSNSSSGANISYSWNTTDGNITSDPNQISITTDQNGTYSLTVVNTVNGCQSVDEVKILGDNSQPQANISGQTQLNCTLTESILNANNGGNAPNQIYAWSTTDGNILSGANSVDAVVDQSGTYSVTITNTSSGCSDEASVVITLDQDEPSISGSEDLSIDCNNQISSLSISSELNVDFNWYTITGSAQIVAGQGTSIANVMGPGTIVVLVTNSINGCFSTDTIDIQLNNDLPIASAGIDFESCNASVSLSANIGEDVSGEWSTLESGTQIDIINDPNPQVSGLKEGENTFIWTLVSEDCGAYSSDTVKVNFIPAPVANDDEVEVNQGFGTINIDLIQNDEYGIGGALPIVSILSDPEEGVITGHISGRLAYSIDQSDIFGTYTFDYEICDDLCSTNCDTATVTIIVNQEVTVPIDTSINTFSSDPISLGITPNGDGLNEFLVFDELISSAVQYQTKRLIVYNRWGDIVHESRPYQNDWAGTNKKGQPLPQGTYYFVMQLDIGTGAIIEGDVTILK